jgi:CubicO group peptidase (beta-lactamase class C family)
MKRLFYLIVSFCSLTVLAQDGQKERIDVVQVKLVQFFNAQNIDSLYGLTGTGFKKNLTAATFKTVCENNLFPLGNIRASEFEKIDKGVSKYKATFETAILSMYLSLDEDGLLSTFLFQPYKKEIPADFKKTKTDNVLLTELDKKIEAIIQPFMYESKTVGMSIGILKDGKTYFYNYGETKKGNGQIPSSKNLYEIGSVTKTFTGILLAKAVVEKKIALNDPVNKYLPKDIPVIKFGNDTLKIIHLSNHTSGLPPLPDNFGNDYSTNPYKYYDDTNLLSYLKHASLSRKPGDKWEYCNLAVGLLGYILQQVNNMPFEKMVSEFICSKIGMVNTKQFLLKKDSALFIQGYNESILPQGQWDFKALAAAGGLRSNTEDMLKYASAQLVAANIALQTAINLSHQPTFDAGQQQIALNWFIQDWGWGEILFHGGQTGGYKSFLAINEKTKNAVIILANTAISNDAVGVKILGYLDKQK